MDKNNRGGGSLKVVCKYDPLSLAWIGGERGNQNDKTRVGHAKWITVVRNVRGTCIKGVKGGDTFGKGKKLSPQGRKGCLGLTENKTNCLMTYGGGEEKGRVKKGAREKRGG